MTKVEKVNIERLITLKNVNMEDKKQALEIYIKYISKYNKFCLTCPSSVRILFHQLRFWWNKQKQNYTFIKEL
tara:strand:- start:3068 stop:3286 length:219 start_codon:yes stop_codon:yes gene_type:complete